MSKLKEAQVIHDSKLPIDTSARTELISEMASELSEHGVVNYLNESDIYIYIDELDSWLNNEVLKGGLIKSKINQYKRLQYELCKSMIEDIINKEGEG